MCGSSPTSGPSTLTRRSRSTGSLTGTSAGSTSPGTTTGYSATAPAALTWSNMPGRRSSDTRWSKPGLLLMTRPWPGTGPVGGGERHPHHWITSACDYSSRSEVAARGVGNFSLSLITHRRARASGSSGCALLGRPGQTGHGLPGARHVGRRQHPSSHTCPMLLTPYAKVADGPTAMPARPLGLLEPDARITCLSGSQGARAQQCARATRRTRG
jgi:hypothetical protein